MSRPRVRDDLAPMEGYHSPQMDVDVRLNTNESPEPPPAEFDIALRDRLDSINWHRYPDRTALQLRESIAEVESGAAGRALDADQVFVANGSNEALQSVCLAYGGAGRSVATFEPTYALHSHIAKIAGAEVISASRDENFNLDLGAAEELITSWKPSITFLCSPNNPTGAVETTQTIETVLKLVESVDGILVVDEAYGQFAAHSALELVSEDRSLLVSRTFSKTWSAAALRLGYLIGPSWAVSDLFRVVLPYHLDAFKQIAGRVALDFHHEMEARVAFLVEERGRVATALDELPLDQWPSGANFILFRPRAVPGDELWNRLVESGVLVRNCASWPGLTDCLRVTLGTRAENDRFLVALQEVLG